MICCTTLYTLEVDNPKVALDQILEQLNEKIKLKKNTIGIMQCHVEFAISGTAKYICENLPFETVGVTSASQIVNNIAGEIIFTLFIISADDVDFIIGLTDSLKDNVQEKIVSSYDKTKKNITDELKLILIFPPFGICSGDNIVRAWTKCAPNVPIFGGAAISDSVNYENSETFYNGINYNDKMPFVLCYGNIKPRFLISSLSGETSLTTKAEITKAEGSTIKEINNTNPKVFFDNLKFIGNPGYTPLMLDLVKREDHDGVPILRALIHFDENGYATLIGDVEAGSVFTLLQLNSDDILATLKTTLQEIKSIDDVNGILSFSCANRRVAFLSQNEPLKELEETKEILNTDIPFMIGYIGGEYCPTSMKDGKPVNRFHNFTMVTLVL